MRRAIAAVVGTVAGLVLLLSFKTHGTAAVSTAPATPATRTTATAATTTAPTTTASRKTTSTKTVTGDVSETRYGPVQVRVTVRGGKVVAVAATEYPSGDPRSQ